MDVVQSSCFLLPHDFYHLFYLVGAVHREGALVDEIDVELVEVGKRLGHEVRIEKLTVLAAPEAGQFLHLQLLPDD